MTNNVEQIRSRKSIDLAIWLVILFFLCIGVYGNSHYANDYSVYQRALPLILLATISIFLALKTEQGGQFSRLVKESRSEIRRVVWPTRQEANHTTFVVSVVVVVMGVVLWALDWFFNLLVSSVIG